jgi:hypothetical protein
MALVNNMSEERFEGVGGLTIFLRSWRPEGKPCRRLYNSQAAHCPLIAEASDTTAVVLL